MNTKYYLILTTILVVCFAISACEGSEGPTGPQGPQGIQGPEGTQGIQGPQGEEGTANVIYSDWLDLDWNLVDEPDFKVMIIEDENTSGDFRDSGALIMYYKIVDSEGTTGIFLMPVIDTQTRFDYFLVVNEEAGIDGMAVRYYRDSGSDPLPELDGQIRYILLPGGIPAKMQSNFFNDYAAVREYFGILD